RRARSGVPCLASRRSMTKLSPNTRRPSSSSRKTRFLTSAGAKSSTIRRSTTKPSPNSRRPSSSIRNSRSLTTLGAVRSTTRASTTKPSPSSRRPPSSIRKTRFLTSDGATCSTSSRNTTKPSPSSRRPSSSIRNSRSLTTDGATCSTSSRNTTKPTPKSRRPGSFRALNKCGRGTRSSFQHGYILPAYRLRLRLQRLQISDHCFGVGSIHVVLRHRRTRWLPVGRKPGHEKLDCLLMVPAFQPGNVGRSVGPVGHGNGGHKGQLGALQPFSRDVFALLVHRGVTIAALSDHFHEVFAVGDLLLAGSLGWRGHAVGGSYHAQRSDNDYHHHFLHVSSP